MMKLRVTLLALYTLFVSAEAYAQPASPIVQFWVWGNTSAWYNPTLPTPLTPDTVMNQFNWDALPSGRIASTRANGGGWVAWAVATQGIASSQYPRPGNVFNNYNAVASQYTAGQSIFFGTWDWVESGMLVGTVDLFYCDLCNGGGAASATTQSLSGKWWNTSLYIR